MKEKQLDEKQINNESPKDLEKNIETASETNDVTEEPSKKTKRKKKTGTEKKDSELDLLNEKLLRIAAEYDNYRKRSEKEKSESFSNGKVFVVERLLPVLDTLEIAAATESSDAEYKKGVELIISLFKDTLSSLDVEEMDVLGKEFDPNTCCAVSVEENGEQKSGTVLRVMQKGYTIGDRVIRPAAVCVCH
jgi:molecular chaperone GrpE